VQQVTEPPLQSAVTEVGVPCALCLTCVCLTLEVRKFVIDTVARAALYCLHVCSAVHLSRILSDGLGYSFSVFPRSRNLTFRSALLYLSTSPQQPAQQRPVPSVNTAGDGGGGGTTSNLLDVLKQRKNHNLTREEADAVIQLLQGQGVREKAAVETEAAPSLTAPPSTSMPPPPPVGLFQTPSSAGPIAPRSSDPAEEITPFSGIRDYLRQVNSERRRVPLALPNARGVLRRGATGVPVSGFRSLYGADSASQPPTLLGMASAGGNSRASSALGAGRSSGYGLYNGPGSPPTASGAAMEWKPPGAALLSPGTKRSRDTAELEVHDREHGRRTAQKVSSTSEVRAPEDIHAPPAVPKATPLKASTGGKGPAATAVTTDTARRILQTLDRISGPSTINSVDGTSASPAAKPLNLSSSLNKAAAATSALHGLRGVQRATPGKPFAPIGKRSPASLIASHSKPSSAPKSSPLQFNPNVLKDSEKPSASPASSPAPVPEPEGPPPLTSIPKAKSLLGEKTQPPVGSGGVAVKPPLDAAPGPAKSAALPKFDFGEASTTTKSSSPLVSTTTADNLPSYTFGKEEADQPKYSFRSDDDDVIDSVRYGSESVGEEMDIIKFTFTEGWRAPTSSSPHLTISTSKDNLPTLSSSAPATVPVILPGGPLGKAAEPSKVTEPEKPKEKAAAPKGSLWSADFLKKNQEHQAKVQAAIDEEERKGNDPPAVAAAPSPFAPPDSIPASKAPSFGFGTDSTQVSAPASSAAPAASFSFGFPSASGQPVGSEIPKEIGKPVVQASSPFTFGVTETASASNDKPAGTVSTATPVAFTFGVTVPASTSAEKAVEKTVDELAEKAVDAPAAESAPFTFGASAPATSTPPLSAKAPAFTFGAVPKPKDTESVAATEHTKSPVSFGKEAGIIKGSNSGSTSTPAFTFGTPSSLTPNPTFSTLSSTAVPSLGAAAPPATTDMAPASTSAPFTFGGTSTGTFGTVTKSADESAPETPGGAFTFGTQAGAEPAAALGVTSSASAAGAAASAPAFGAPSSTPAFGAASSTPAFGAASSTPAFGAASSTPAFGAASSTPAFGAASSTPAFGAASSTPAFGSASSTPAFGAASSTPAFGAASSTPAFGVAASTSAFGAASAAAPAFGGTSATPSFGGDAPSPFGGGLTASASTGGFGGFGSSTPQEAPTGGAFTFGASTSPASAPGTDAGANPFGTTSSGFGGSSVAPTFGGATSTPFGGGGDAAPSAPSPFSGGFSASGGVSPAPTFGGAGGFSAITSGEGGAAANPFGGGFSAPSAGISPAPAFGGGGGFGSGAPPPLNAPAMFGGAGGGMPMGGGMSMGAGDAPTGGRKPVKKARRPPKRNN
jgi:hypothetical protein